MVRGASEVSEVSEVMVDGPGLMMVREPGVGGYRLARRAASYIWNTLDP
jgi:hypothetical protein